MTDKHLQTPKTETESGSPSNPPSDSEAARESGEWSPRVETGVVERLTITATGCYRYAMKPELIEALEISIAAHMKAYGLEEITVRSHVVSGDEAKGPQACQEKS